MVEMLTQESVFASSFQQNVVLFYLDALVRQVLDIIICGQPMPGKEIKLTELPVKLRTYARLAVQWDVMYGKIIDECTKDTPNLGQQLQRLRARKQVRRKGVAKEEEEEAKEGITGSPSSSSTGGSKKRARGEEEDNKEAKAVDAAN